MAPDQEWTRPAGALFQLIASFLMVMWDLGLDPTASTIRHLWTCQQGGGSFGVPLSNYLGWFFTEPPQWLARTLSRRQLAPPVGRERVRENAWSRQQESNP
jgi:uncharacterized membrane protein